MTVRRRTASPGLTPRARHNKGPLDVELSATAQQLLARHVESVGALDLLLLLHERRDWDVRELCVELRCPRPWAEAQLARLADAGLVAEDAPGHVHYRRGPRFGPAADEIARACRQHRGAVARFIFARRPDQLAR